MAPLPITRSTVPWRRFLLFAVAFLVPCAVLAILAYRTIALDAELGRRRLEDDARQMSTAVGQELIAALDRVKSVVAASRESCGPRTKPDPDNVAVVGWLQDGRLLLPWDCDAAVADARLALARPPFADHIVRGEQLEIARGEPLAAVAEYRRAAEVAALPVQAAYAELLIARAADKAGQTSQAAALDRRALARPLSVVDEHGVPFALYAARRVAERTSSSLADVRSAGETAAVVANNARFGPTAWHMALGVAGAARTREPALASVAAALIEQSPARGRRFELAAALRSGIGAILAQLPAASDPSAAPTWVPFGAPPSLVTTAPRPGGSLVLAVDAQPVFDGLDSVRRCRASASCAVRLLFDAAGGGLPLGGGLPGARLDYRFSGGPRDALRATVQRRFYLTVLLVVTGLSLLGAYLLWRDVRREVRTAEMRSQFVASVSHELKTPLTAIRMFAETLRMGRPAHESGRNEYLDIIVNESERLTRLLNNVLDFSRIEQGRKQYHMAPHDLADVVQAAARAMRYPLEQQGFDLRIAMDPALPLAPVDADAVEQAILNLLANAVKYSGDGRTIDLRLERDRDFAVISVRDQGIGIPAEEHGRIFEKFYRVASAENDRIPGTGLGLTLVEHIARAHGGSVRVESAPGSGSTFVLRLPLATEV